MYSGGQDARIAVTDPRTGKLAGEFLGHEKVVDALAIDPSGSRVVSVSSDRTVRSWDVAGQRQITVLEGNKDAVVALALTPDGSQAVTGGYDGRLRRWGL